MNLKVNFIKLGSGESFAANVVAWQLEHGRHDLPWQGTCDPYRVWLSEVMLQQTQVATVCDYFHRFVCRFPSVNALAQASLDEVLHLWSGLGYYSRARNMHRCAQVLVREHAGAFPTSAAQLKTLPGIGTSTAAAIASMCFGERVAILDGNVKRVLTRYLGFDADLSKSANERHLLSTATDLLPQADLARSMPIYTQGVMDMGATVCTPKHPACDHCPVQTRCVAHAKGQAERYPVKTRRIKRTTQVIWMLWASSEDGCVSLSRRPAPGVWAGLYCFDLFDSIEALRAALPVGYRQAATELESFKHVLTHKDLYLHPVRVVLPKAMALDTTGQWFSPAQWKQLGMPAPVTRMLASGLPDGV